MKNKKTATLTVRILEEDKEKLEDEANARGLTLSELTKEMIHKETGGSSYDKNLMAEKKDIGLPKKRCPYCAIVVDWAFVKVSNLSLGEDGKYCPNPDCRKLVYTYSEEKGWQEQEPKTKEEQEPKTKEEKEFDDLIEAVVLFKAGELKEEELDEKTKKLIINLSTLELCPRCFHCICLKDGKCPNCGLVKKGDEWEAFKEKESEKKKKEKEKVSGSLLGGWLTFDSEEESEEE